MEDNFVLAGLAESADSADSRYGWTAQTKISELTDSLESNLWINYFPQINTSK